MSAYTTRITGSIYSSATGAKITSGQLLIRPKTFVPLSPQYSFDGGIVAPLTVTVPIPPSGDLDFTLVAPPTNVTYVVEYDSDPNDTDTPIEFKAGYFKDEWTALGNLPVDYATRVKSDEPIIYYRLGETSGTSAVDSSGAGRHGTYAGGFTLGVTGAVGDGDKAVSLNGSGSQVTTPSIAEAITRITFEAFVKVTNVATNQAICGVETAGSNYFGIYSSHIRLNLLINGSEVTLNDATTLLNNTYYHVAGSYDGSSMRIFVNGVQTSIFGGLSGSVQFGPNAIINIGKRTSAVPDRLVGTLDEFAVFARGLSAADILSHYEGRNVSSSVIDISDLF